MSREIFMDAWRAKIQAYTCQSAEMVAYSLAKACREALSKAAQIRGV